MAIKSRIQLKSDTEQNWNKARNFIPLKSEVIIYLTDEAHPFSRLKVGDGTTPVIDLPFIDAYTVNGTNINVNTKEYWDSNKNYIPKIGEIIIYLNNKYIEENIGVAGLKIGDGKTYLIDLPFLGELEQNSFNQHINDTTMHITNEERNFWNNKLNCENEIIEEVLFLNRN